MKDDSNHSNDKSDDFIEGLKDAADPRGKRGQLNIFIAFCIAVLYFAIRSL